MVAMKIILTGGGTAGHVTPNLALLPLLHRAGYTCVYVGSYTGIERELITAEKIPYYPIHTGKLRRYLDVKNFTDTLRVLRGLGDALKVLRREKPDVIFSKGGFVAVPVVVAAWLRKVPVVLHESDISPGLANKLSLPFARAVCVSFPETLRYLPKAALTGTPIRAGLLAGDRARGRALCGFPDKKPVALVMGGSSGSAFLNQCLRAALPSLLHSFCVAHICGKGNLAEPQPGYAQFEYVTEGLPHLFAAADIIASRAGANAISEFLALRKPALLVPLSKRASRGDQLLNADSFLRQGFSQVLREESLTPQALAAALADLYAQREHYTTAMTKAAGRDGAEAVLRVIVQNTAQR
jgi:UDP-N-acetylglucosamine--N-acetylmuramyl-(pentapeptide) pyrophosphoryl-undecaprenol N-acetylglucosamine transferase